MYTKDGETVRNKLPFDEVDKSVGRWVNINQLRNNLLLGRAVFWGKLVFLLCSFWESLGSDSKDGFRGIWGQGLKWPSWTIRLKLTSWLWFWCYIWDICLDYVHILYIMMYIYIWDELVAPWFNENFRSWAVGSWKWSWATAKLAKIINGVPQK